MQAKLPILSFVDVKSIEAYFSKSADGHAGFWLKLAKKGAPDPTIT